MVRTGVALLVVLLGLGCDRDGLPFSNTPQGSLADATVDALTPDGDATPDADGEALSLDAFIAAQMSEAQIPGLALAVVRAEGDGWRRTFGLANVDQALPVDERSVFHMASISKPVSTWSLMQAVEREEVALDDDLSDLAGFDVRSPLSPAQPVEVRHVLTHTTGLADDFFVLSRATSVGDPELSSGAFLQGYIAPGGDFYSEANWSTAPGTRYDYCNAAFGFVGHLVEVVGGASFEALAKRDLFEPLGMTDSGFSLADVSGKVLAVGYTSSGTEFTAEEARGYPYRSASSFRSSLRDMERFALAWLRGGELDGVRVLQEDTVRSMADVPFPELNGNQAITNRFRRINGRDYLGHTGSSFEGSAALMFDTEYRYALILMSNSNAFFVANLGVTEGSDALWAILRRVEEDAVAGAL
ncbi:MAG: serine hydrolase domain-containing protein [Myxococcota bacterium]